MGEDKLQKLHSNLVKDGYDLPDYNAFKTDMQDANKLKTLHDNLLKDEYDLPDYDTFSSDMGVKKKRIYATIRDFFNFSISLRSPIVISRKKEG
tara:strand:- start:1540 stop:1821 length:282 start_codon:yes stop_codon:yes gene_type:complete